MAAIEQKAPSSETVLEELSYLSSVAFEFIQQNHNAKGALQRAPAALELVSQMIQDLRYAELRDSGNVQINTRMDAIEWLAWNDLWYYAYTDGRSKEGKLARAEEHQAKERLFEDIARYEHLQLDPMIAYLDLIENFHLARLVVKNPIGLLAQERNIDKVAADQMLATHRVVNAARVLGFSKTRRATMEERRGKVGVVIPLGKRGGRQLELQIQPGSPVVGKLEVQPFYPGLLVNVLYGDNGGNPFAMKQEDMITLREGVRAVRAGAMFAGLGIAEAA